MFEALSKISWCDAHAAYHPFDDVAVVAKQSPWGTAVVAVIGSNLLPFKWTGANSAAPVLQGEHCLTGCSIHASSCLALTFSACLQLIWRVARDRCCALRSMTCALKGVLPLLHIRLIAVGFVLILPLLIADALSLTFALQVGFAPSFLVGLVLCPLFLSAVAFFHHITQIFLWVMMRHGACLTDARHVYP